MPVLDLKHMETDRLKALPVKWRNAKKEHAAALKAKKVSFSKGLGKLLDKRPSLYAPFKTKSLKITKPLIIVRGELNSIKSNGKSILEAVKSYQAKIKGLGGEAEKDLNSALVDIKQAAQFDVDYVNAKLKK
jgi:hypothetical protein